MSSDSLRRAMGLGSSQTGLYLWIRHRFSFLLLFPLSLWMLFFEMPEVSRILANSLDLKNDLYLWIARGGHSIIVFLWICLLIYHGMLSLHVMIEDYVHTLWMKTLFVLLLRTASGLMVLVALMCFLKLWVF